MSEPYICKLCGKPVIAGQVRHGATNNHYYCHYPEGQPAVASTDEVIARMDAAMRSFGFKPKRAKEGEGATAKKAKAKALAALEKVLGTTPYDVTFWNQQGAHRGPKWDLDRWGLNFSFDYLGHSMRGSASCLATMTDCARAISMEAKEDTKLAFSFDMLPVYSRKEPK